MGYKGDLIMDAPSYGVDYLPDGDNSCYIKDLIIEVMMIALFMVAYGTNAIFGDRIESAQYSDSPDSPE